MATCIFCGSDDVEREHVLAEWLAEHMSFSGSVWVFPWKADRRQFKAKDSFGLVVKRICHTCNGGWMSDIESRASPILGPLVAGTSEVLTTEDQRTLVIWLWKLMMVAEHAAANNFFTEAERRLFRETGAPPHPSEFRAFIAPFKSEGTPQLVAWTATHWDGPGKQVRLADVNCLTAAIGRLVVQGAYARLYPPAREQFALPVKDIPFHVQQVWPPTGQIRPNAIPAIADSDYRLLVERAGPGPIVWPYTRTVE